MDISTIGKKENLFLPTCTFILIRIHEKRRKKETVIRMSEGKITDNDMN